MTEERDRERLGRGAQLGDALAPPERIVQLLDEKVEHSVLAQEGVGDVHDDVVAHAARGRAPPGHPGQAIRSGRPLAGSAPVGVTSTSTSWTSRRLRSVRTGAPGADVTVAPVAFTW